MRCSDALVPVARDADRPLDPRCRADRAARPGVRAGLTVLTGETGAGKSILLDSLGLAIGARAETGLVRATAEQASVTACFTPPDDHAVGGRCSTSMGWPARTRSSCAASSRRTADRAPSSTTIRWASDCCGGSARLLVEVQGQHEQMSLADPAQPRRPAGCVRRAGAACAQAVAEAWRAWRDALKALEQAREAIAAAERDEEWLRHAVDELATLAPRLGEEDALARERQRLQQNERRAEAIAAALSELTPRDRRGAGPAASLRAAARALQRLVPVRPAGGGEPGRSGTRRAGTGGGGAGRGGNLADPSGRRCRGRSPPAGTVGGAAVRAARRRPQARCRGARPAGVAGYAGRPAGRAGNRGGGDRGAGAGGARHARNVMPPPPASCRPRAPPPPAGWRRRWPGSCRRCGWTRRGSSPRSRDLPETGWGPGGTDQVRFLIATNPGQEPGPLARVASGGELSRLMLAMKVVLSAGSAVPTLVFDEVDSGIGGATAAAVGERLARVAEGVQVLVVTHSPQVAARGAAHLRVAKAVGPGPHRDDGEPAWRRTSGGRRSPGCWPERRCPTRPGRRRTICCGCRGRPRGCWCEGTLGAYPDRHCPALSGRTYTSTCRRQVARTSRVNDRLLMERSTNAGTRPDDRIPKPPSTP